MRDCAGDLDTEGTFGKFYFNTGSSFSYGLGGNDETTLIVSKQSYTKSYKVKFDPNKSGFINDIH